MLAVYPCLAAQAKAQRAGEVDQLLERVRALRGTVPKDFEFDRLDANARWMGVFSTPMFLSIHDHGV